MKNPFPPFLDRRIFTSPERTELQEFSPVTRWFKFGLAFLFFGLATRYILHPWNPNLMDDVGWMQPGSLMPTTSVSAAYNWLKGIVIGQEQDLGRFRPLWVLYSGVIYAICDQAPLIARLLRFIEWTLALFLWSRAFRSTREAPIWIAVLSLGCPYFYDTLFLMSIQEAHIIFFTGLFLFGNSLEGTKRGVALRFTGMMGGLLSKEPSALFFLGFGVMEFIFHYRSLSLSKKIQIGLEIALTLGFLYLISLIGKKGSYTRGAFKFNLDILKPVFFFIPRNLPKANPFAFLLASAMAASSVLKPSLWRPVGKSILQIAPLIGGVALFTGGIILWGRGSYYLAPLAPMLAAPIALLYLWTVAPDARRRFRKTALFLEVVLLIGAIGLGFRSIEKQFQKNQEIGTMTGFLQTQLMGKNSRPIYYPKENGISEQISSLRLLMKNKGVSLKNALSPAEEDDAFLIYHVNDAPLNESLLPHVRQFNLFNTQYWRVAAIDRRAAPFCLSFQQ